MNMDPLEYLLDRMFDADGLPSFIIEQPHLHCPCAGTGWLGREWLYRRESSCTCPAQSDDFMHIVHDIACDAVPCPLCPLEEVAGE